MPDALAKRVADEAVKRRYASTAAFIRTAVENELEGPRAAQISVEMRTVATLDRLSRQLRSIANAQQALFAFTDALARVLFHCLPEPAGPLHDQCLARARDRHSKLLKMAALGIKGDGAAALASLTGGADER